MGNNKHSNYDRNPAVEGLLNVLSQANYDLNSVRSKLEEEFQLAYPDNANPMELVNRVKKVQEDITSLKVQCQEMLIAKQELIEKAREILVGNRNTLLRMQASTGIPADDDDDSAFEDFNRIFDEWSAQVRFKTGKDGEDEDSPDVNRLFFSSVMEAV